MRLDGIRFGTEQIMLTCLQVNEEVSRLLATIKAYLSGENEVEPSADVIAQVANEVYAQDVLSLMVVHLAKFEFEVSPRTIEQLSAAY